MAVAAAFGALPGCVPFVLALAAARSRCGAVALLLWPVTIADLAWRRVPRLTAPPPVRCPCATVGLRSIALRACGPNASLVPGASLCGPAARRVALSCAALLASRLLRFHRVGVSRDRNVSSSHLLARVTSMIRLAAAAPSVVSAANPPAHPHRRSAFPCLPPNERSHRLRDRRRSRPADITREEFLARCLTTHRCFGR